LGGDRQFESGIELLEGVLLNNLGNVTTGDSGGIGIYTVD
jgi:hypothetical protein